MASNPGPTTKPSVYLQDEEEVRKVFERFDANTDGKISAAELRGVLKDLGSDTSDKEVAQMMQQRGAFQLYDQDQDGKISAEELHQILTRLGEHCSVGDCTEI